MGPSRFMIVGIVVCALGLSACGRKGPLEPPPTPEDAPPEASQSPEPEEKKSFLLDFLIQ